MKPDDTQWWSALSLSERSCLARNGLGRSGVPAATHERRIRRWLEQSPFQRSEIFTQRIAQDGLTPDSFRELVARSPQSLAAELERPPWLTALADAYTSDSAVECAPGHPSFMALIEPLIQKRYARFAADLDVLESRGRVIWDRAAVRTQVVANTAASTFPMLGRTLALELHVAGMRGMLRGETAEERYASFCELLSVRGFASDLMREYPVMARLLATAVEQAMAYALEFLEHISSDHAALERMTRTKLGKVTQFASGQGDVHRSGRSVLTVTFESGTRVIYKPRSLGMDVGFADLLDWLHAVGGTPAMRTPWVLDRGDYGWVEFIEAAPCASQEDVRRFYERLGCYLGLLYGLEATDFHFENLIAAGEYPVLVDLETMFHPAIPQNPPPDGAATLVRRDIMKSVLRTGLLPQRTLVAPDEEYDVSGIGGEAGQLSLLPVPTWEEFGSDRMRMVRRRVRIRGRDNRARLHGTVIDPAAHVDALIGGFVQVYEVLRCHRETLLAAGGPIDRLRRHPVRVVVRPTRLYDRLLNESYHPDVLRDALERDRLLDHLWSTVSHAPSYASVIPAEQRDLRRGDVPYFTTHPDSRDLWTSDGERIADYLSATSLESVAAQLHALDRTDRQRQVWYIRSSLGTLVTSRPHHDVAVDAQSHSLQRPCEPDALHTARALGDTLCDLALHDDRYVAWPGLMLIGERGWSIQPSGYDFYDGALGIGHFLTYLGAVTGNDRYTGCAQRVLSSFRTETLPLLLGIEAGGDVAHRMGAFSGVGGVVYALTHLGGVWRDPTCWDDAVRIADHFGPVAARDPHHDVISGNSGWVLSLLALHDVTRSAAVLGHAEFAGDQLLRAARTMSHGVAWPSADAGGVGLTGASHGAAGIALALAALGARSSQSRFTDAARAALRYESALFDSAAGNWPDLRPVDGSQDRERRCMWAWCHGAPGIGIVRARLLPYLEDAALLDDIRAAAQSTVAQPLLGNHSLCHGDLGNLEALLAMRPWLDDPALVARVDERRSAVLADVCARGPVCGVPTGTQTPGLMNGIAGIGLALLRLAAPDRVPSVLSLSAPHC